jgi:LacI family transcriptional regulator
MSNLKVAIISPLYSGCDRRILEGAMKCARDHGNQGVCVWAHWHPRSKMSAGLPRSAEVEIARQGVRGLLVDIWNPLMLRRLQKTGIPTVDVGGGFGSHEVTSVHVDNAAVGRLAAKHLIDRGLKNFGFWRHNRPLHAIQRQEAFVAELRKAGFKCSIFDKPVKPDFPRSQGPARRWLESLPKPVGIMCWCDWQAVIAQYVCSQASLAIPEEVAMVGVDNDDLCRLQCPVPLSSIETNPYNIGYKAMEVLYRMIRTGSRPLRHFLLPPGNVVARQSTDILAMDKPRLVEAIRFIQSHSDKPISVSDILKAVPISRRSLEYQIKETLGRTPRQEIQRAHVDRSKMLMEEADLSFADIADLSGFKTQSQFSAIFRRFTKFTPGQYRRRLPSVKASQSQVPGA